VVEVELIHSLLHLLLLLVVAVQDHSILFQMDLQMVFQVVLVVAVAHFLLV
jgi:hypothetical protein